MFNKSYQKKCHSLTDFHYIRAILGGNWKI